MKADLASLLGTDDSSAPEADPKPSIGDALGIPSGDDEDSGAASGTDVTDEAKHELGEKLLTAFTSKDPIAMFNAVQGVLALQD